MANETKYPSVEILTFEQWCDKQGIELCEDCQGKGDHECFTCDGQGVMDGSECFVCFGRKKFKCPCGTKEQTEQLRTQYNRIKNHELEILQELTRQK